MSQHKGRIVVVGSINLDLVSKVPHFPRPGETVRGTTFDSFSGGKGANQAVAVARLQHPVEMIGMLGNDRIGEELLDNLKREGVGISHVGIAPGSSGTATVLVEDSGENSIVIVPGANAALTPDVIRSKASVIASAGLVMTQLETPLDTIETLAEICEEASVPLMLDPAPAMNISSHILRKVSWFTPNETEAAFYAPDVDAVEELITRLSTLGPTNVILKRGSAGSAIRLSGQTTVMIGAPRVEAVDTTAAGDSFNAAFAVGLMNLASPIESGRFASAAAAICVTRGGAQPSLAFRDEVEHALAKGILAGESL